MVSHALARIDRAGEKHQRRVSRVRAGHEFHVALELDHIVILAALDGFKDAQSLRLGKARDMRQEAPADALMLMVLADRDGDLAPIERVVAGQQPSSPRLL